MYHRIFHRRNKQTHSKMEVDEIFILIIKRALNALPITYIVSGVHELLDVQSEKGKHKKVFFIPKECYTNGMNSRQCRELFDLEKTEFCRRTQEIKICFRSKPFVRLHTEGTAVQPNETNGTMKGNVLISRCTNGTKT